MHRHIGLAGIVQTENFLSFYQAILKHTPLKQSLSKIIGYKSHNITSAKHPQVFDFYFCHQS